MTDLTAKIAALPEWAERVDAEVQPWQTIVRDRGCALARLALAREWIEDAHQYDCEVVTDKYPQYAQCTCGRDQLLAALEEPK